MRRSDVPELQYIAPIANVPSILEHGLLSHRRALSLMPVSVADADVQDRRAGKVIPGGRPLHDYVNLYICARNPMLYHVSQGTRHQRLRVIGVSTDVLDLPHVVVSDMNAARGMAAFRSI